MWKSVDVNQQKRFIKFDRKDDCSTVYYTDVMTVWMEKLTLTILSERCKHMNSLIEAEPEDLATHIYSLIADGNKGTQFTSKEDGDARTLHIESRLAGIPFYFMFRMEKMNADVLCKELTVPMMLLVLRQQAYLAQLRDMLIAKDAEIEQYKLEGAILKKRKLETEPFHEGDFNYSENKIVCSNNEMNPSQLFSEVCPLLSSVPASDRNSSNRHVESIEVVPEVKTEDVPEIKPDDIQNSKSEDEPNFLSNVSTVKNSSANVKESISDKKCAVKQKVATKKPKLRI